MAYADERDQLVKLRAETKAAETALRAKAVRLFDLYRPMKAALSTWSPKWYAMHIHGIAYGENEISYSCTWGECERTFVSLPSALLDRDEAGMKAGIAEVLAEEGRKFEEKAERRRKASEEAEKARLQEMADKLGYDLAPRP
jgi:hypothetical protein